MYVTPSPTLCHKMNTYEGCPKIARTSLFFLNPTSFFNDFFTEATLNIFGYEEEIIRLIITLSSD